MAYDYEKSKSLYEAMDKQQQQQFMEQNKNDANVQRFAKEYAAEKSGKLSPNTTSPSLNQNTQNKTNELNNRVAETNNTINELKTQTSKMSGYPTEYQGQGSVNTKKDPSSSPYVNQGNGTYSYNPKSGYYEVQGQTTQTQGGEKIRQFWDSLSYEEQQQRLNENPNLKASLDKYGATYKQQEVKPETKPEGGETPSEGWDYQSDSPERMAEIAANLEGYKQTMPYLFNDKKAFDDFFINGKGRSQAQIDFLNQWFENNQKYGKYDALTPDSIGYGIAYGDIPEDYLTMLKTTDPEKYQAALQAKQDAEDKIKDRTALDTTSVLSGDSEATITSKAIEWLKSQGLFLDKDGNLIDDRTENYATDEEKQYAKDTADIIARNLEIDNIVKHTYEDLVKAYPGATKATLMAMAQDRNSDLLREKENNNVELTRLQGYMDYMQSERQERTRIGENAINQLQKQYGMYYQYTPQGMSELAQAQYAATNVTLDQADYGTDTQKQMALDSVLTPIYQQYGDIIQRPMAQVINDVIALAKNKGISLSQALEENFMSFLRQKPEYLQRTSGGIGEWTVIGEDELGNKVYGFVNSSTGVVVPYGDVRGGVSGGGTIGADGVYQFSDEEVREVGSDGKFTDTVGNDINSIGHILNSEDGLRIGTYTNPKGYTYNVYATREDGIQAAENLLRKGYYGMTLGDAAQKWIGQGKNISDAKEVIQSKGLGLNDKLSDANVRKFIEAIGTREGTLKGQSLDERSKGGKDLSGYKQPEGEAAGKFDKGLELVYQEYQDANSAEKAKIAARQGKTTQQMDSELREYTGWRNANDSKALINEIDKLLDGEIKIPSARQRMDTADTGELDPITSFFTVGSSKQSNRNWMYAHNLIHDTLGMDKLINLKSRGATFGALSDPEREAINNVATKLAPGMDDETYKQTLRDIRAQLVDAAHGYLDDYHYEGGTVQNSANELGLKKVR